MADRRPSLQPLDERVVPDAQIQLVNNSPYDGVATVDVYVNDARVADDLAFQSATPFFAVPAGRVIKIDVVAGPAADNKSTLSSDTHTLADGTAYAAMVVGNPGDRAGPDTFGLALAKAKTAAGSDTDVTFLLANGSPDGTPVEVSIRDVATVAADVRPGGYDDAYVTTAAGQYTLDVVERDGLHKVGSYDLDLAEAGGQAVLLTTTGFYGPGVPKPAGYPGYQMLAVYADGTTEVLDAVTPKPVTGTVAVGGPGGAALVNAAGEVTLNVVPFPGGTTSVRVASGDVTGDGVTDVVVGGGPGSPSTVVVYDGKTGATVRAIDAFDGFTGGVFVAAGDVNKDGYADVVVTPDTRGGPRVKVVSGKGGDVLADFFAIEDGFRGGVRAAVGDMTGDGFADVVVSAGPGGGPRIAGFDGATLAGTTPPQKLFADFFVFDPALRNGAYVAIGDVNGDGYGDLIAGAGQGGSPHVRVLSGHGLTQLAGTEYELASFFAGDQKSRQGVRVTATDFDDDDLADIVVGLGTNGDSQVRAFRGRGIKPGGQPPVAEEWDVMPASPNAGTFVG